MKVSVMIPTTVGGFTYLAKLLPILAQEPDSEMIIIDNCSRDGTLNYLTNYNCTVVVNKQNLGFSKGNNQGGRIAQGEYILCLNNDTMIKPGLIEEMVKTFELDPKIGIVGCLIYLMDTSAKKVQHAGVMFTDEYLPYELGLEIASVAPGILPSDTRVTSVREVPSVTAACMMVKKEVWDKVGGFDEAYINGWEDQDFCLKARELGYKIWYTGKTFIHHRHFGSKSVGRFTHESENRNLFDRTWVASGRAKKVLGDFRQG